MIRFILVLNRQGKIRIAKWYVNYEEKEKQRLILDIHRTMSSRDSRFTNFIEFLNFKIVYKRFAGLFFLVCSDYSDNELSHLELIQLMVELLDQYFGNVTELDLIFNFHKVHALIDELIMGGEVLETSKQAILQSVKKLENQD